MNLDDHSACSTFYTCVMLAMLSGFDQVCAVTPANSGTYGLILMKRLSLYGPLSVQQAPDMINKSRASSVGACACKCAHCLD